MERISEERGHLIVTVNSPGEVYYWLWPLLEEWKNFPPFPRVWVFVPPCQFAAGWEVEAVQNFPLVEKVFSPRETLRFVFGLSRFIPSEKGLVLFLGGDLFYSVLLKKRTGYPLWVYGSSPRWSSQVDRYLVRFEKDWVRFPQSKSRYIGDLLASAVAKKEVEDIFPFGSPRFLFLPGSRRFAYPVLFPLFERWIGILKERYPRASFALGLPPHYRNRMLPAFSMGEVFFGRTSDLIQGADLVITVPGSNNLEVVYREKRGIVIFPVAEALKELPVMGPLVILEWLPCWGKMIKKKILCRRLEKSRWISLPNFLWEKEVLPELKGEISEEQFLKSVEIVLGKKAGMLTKEELPVPDASRRLVESVMREWYGKEAE